jgi:adenylate kinase
LALGKTVFISGVHGVGKTTLARRLSNALQLPYVTASTMLTGFDQPGLATADVLVKQSEFIALRIRQILQSAHLLLVDSHCVLLDTQGDCVKVAMSIYQDIQISAIILLTDNPRQIHARQRQRGGLVLDVKKIAQLQDEEVGHSSAIANQMNAMRAVIDRSHVGFSGAEQLAVATIKPLFSPAP